MGGDDGRVPRRAFGALVTGAAAVSALVACGASSQGTVIAKAEDTYDYGCQQGGTVTGPVAVPAWGPAGNPGAGGCRSRQRRHHV